MIRGRFFAAHPRGTDIVLYVRTLSGEKRVVRVTGFKPYFYVPSELGEYRSIYGERLMRVYADHPGEVPRLREGYEKHYEADVLYVQRFLVDAGITSGLAAPGEEARYDEVRPVEARVDPVYMFIDIEVDSSTGFPDWRDPDKPVISVATYTRGRGYRVFFWHPRAGRGCRERNGVAVCGYPSEEVMLVELVDYLDRVSPDILSGWNIEFDVRYLAARLDRLSRDGSLPWPGHVFSKTRDGFTYVQGSVFDYLEAYRQIASGFNVKPRSYELKEVAVFEGLVNRDEVVVAEEAVSRWRDDPGFLVKYNYMDVWYLVMLEKRHGIIDYYDTIWQIVGTPSIADTLSKARTLDAFLLRLAKRRGVVLPSASKERRHTRYTGAIVLEPRAGLYEDVAVFDMKRYYPNIILTFNVSPETAVPLSRVPEPYRSNIKAIGAKLFFRLEPEGIVPAMARELYGLRDRYEAAGDKARARAAKFLLNSVYGFMGYPGSRIYDVRIASFVTLVAQWGLLRIKEYTDSRGYRVIYGDTDSVFISVPFDEARELEQELNEYLAEKTEEYFGVPRDRVRLSLKFEKYFKRVLFKGVKKKYMAWLVWEKGEERDEIVLVGVAGVRSDYPLFTYNTMNELADLVLRRRAGRDELAKWYREVYKRFTKLSPLDMAFSKKLSREVNEYSASSPPIHVRAAVYSNTYLGTRLGRGDKVRYVYVRRVRCPGLPPTKVVAVTPATEKRVEECFEIDTKTMFENAVNEDASGFLAAAGVRLPPPYYTGFW